MCNLRQSQQTWCAQCLCRSSLLGTRLEVHTLARETVSSPEDAGDMTPGSIMLLRSSFSSKEEIRRCLLRRPACIVIPYSQSRSQFGTFFVFPKNIGFLLYHYILCFPIHWFLVPFHVLSWAWSASV